LQGADIQDFHHIVVVFDHKHSTINNIMKKLITRISFLALLGGIGFVGINCTSSTAPTTTGVPSAVMVMGTAPTSVSVMWTRSSDDASTDTVVATPSSGGASVTAQAAAGVSTATLTLTANQDWSVTVRSGGGASSAASWSSYPAPTGIMANSLSATSVGVEWTTSDPAIASIVATPVGSGSPITISASGSGATKATVTGLTAGTAYTFAVNTTGMPSTAITWAGAARSATVRIYETNDPSSSDPSGLSLIVGSVQAFGTSTSAGHQASIDVVLSSDNTSASGITLVSAGVTGSGIPPTLSGLRMTTFNDNSVLVTGGLDADYYSSDLAALFALGNNTADIPTGTSPSEIIRVKTTDHFYARLEIVPQADGTLYGTNAGGYKFVDVIVSEQSTALLPYAARGIDAAKFFATTRKAGVVNMH
jgi:hypothetical protein